MTSALARGHCSAEPLVQVVTTKYRRLLMRELSLKERQHAERIDGHNIELSGHGAGA